jgi:hypothetical protein
MTDATAICPICKSKAEPLDVVGDTEGFDCPRHGKFHVAGTAIATKPDASPEQWMAALKRAKARSTSDKWPCIMDGDF